jgi:hypothetical protein
MRAPPPPLTDEQAERIAEIVLREYRRIVAERTAKPVAAKTKAAEQ